MRRRKGNREGMGEGKEEGEERGKKREGDKKKGYGKDIKCRDND